MSEVVESAIQDEDVLLEVFPLSFGYGPSWTAALWQEAIMISQQQESGVEHHLLVVNFQHNSSLVIVKHGFYAAFMV